MKSYIYCLLICENLTDWLMVIITAIYVIATIIICCFNGKSAKAAQEQLQESTRQQKQNAKLQLLDKRIEIIAYFDDAVYKLINEWEPDISDDFWSPLLKYKIKALFDIDFANFHAYLKDSFCKINVLNGDYEHSEKHGECKGRDPEVIHKEKIGLLNEISGKYHKEKDRVFTLYIDLNN